MQVIQINYAYGIPVGFTRSTIQTCICDVIQQSNDPSVSQFYRRLIVFRVTVRHTLGEYAKHPNRTNNNTNTHIQYRNR